MTHATPTATDVAALTRDLRAEIGRHVIGMQTHVELLLCAVLAGRHVLVEGVPGVGKTLLVRTLAETLGCSFKRLQFTPDLLPADILGGFVYDPKAGGFELRKGPIFANVILADEINRAPAKTQSALLEVMQERQVTLEGHTLVLERPFFVFATQNPTEHEGVYPLPQAQLDRFAMRLLVDHPTPEDERALLASHRDGRDVPAPTSDGAALLAAQDSLAAVTVSDEILALLVDLAGHVRAHEGVLTGASPRLSLDVMALGRARALLDGRDYVIPDDVKALFVHAANHRVQLTPQAEIRGLTRAQVLDDALQSTHLV